jgi:hypothetical protein
MAEEVTLYRDDNIQVTNLRAMLTGKTYAMANITSVSMHVEEATRIAPIMVIIIGVCGLLIRIATGELQGCAWIGIIALVIGILLFRAATDTYWVRIGSASGEANALRSKDREYIMRIVQALNDAIIRRG